MFGTSLSSVLIKFVDYAELPLSVEFRKDGVTEWSRSRGLTEIGNNEHVFEGKAYELRVRW